MTKEEIIELAREAGLYVGTNISGVQLVGSSYKDGGPLIHLSLDELERFANLVAAKERERCAKECEDQKVGIASYFEIDERINRCAEAIRSLK